VLARALDASGGNVAEAVDAVLAASVAGGAPPSSTAPSRARLPTRRSSGGGVYALGGDSDGGEELLESGGGGGGLSAGGGLGGAGEEADAAAQVRQFDADERLARQLQVRLGETLNAGGGMRTRPPGLCLVGCWGGRRLGLAGSATTAVGGAEEGGQRHTRGRGRLVGCLIPAARGGCCPACVGARVARPAACVRAVLQPSVVARVKPAWAVC